MKRAHYLAAIAALSATAIGSAYAAKAPDNDALTIASAQVGLAQAVTAAEQHTGGKASRAEFEHSKGRAVFDVEVLARDKVMDVKVDSTTGEVIAATADPADHDDHDDAED